MATAPVKTPAQAENTEVKAPAQQAMSPERYKLLAKGYSEGTLTTAEEDEFQAERARVVKGNKARNDAYQTIMKSLTVEGVTFEGLYELKDEFRTMADTFFNSRFKTDNESAKKTSRKSSGTRAESTSNAVNPDTGEEFLILAHIASDQQAAMKTAFTAGKNMSAWVGKNKATDQKFKAGVLGKLEVLAGQQATDAQLKDMGVTREQVAAATPKPRAKKS